VKRTYCTAALGASVGRIADLRLSGEQAVSRRKQASAKAPTERRDGWRAVDHDDLTVHLGAVELPGYEDSFHSGPGGPRIGARHRR
jgi:hypothetical protein